MPTAWIPAALVDEVISPGEDAFTVNYWRHRHEYTHSAPTVEDCVAFIWSGSEWGHLSYCDCEVKNRAGEVVLTYKQLQEQVDALDDDE